MALIAQRAYETRIPYVAEKEEGADQRLRGIVHSYTMLRNNTRDHIVNDTIVSTLILEFLLKKGGSICTEPCYTRKGVKFAKLIYPFIKKEKVQSYIIANVSEKCYEDTKLNRALTVNDLLIDSDKVISRAVYYRIGLNMLCREIISSKSSISKRPAYRP